MEQLELVLKDDLETLVPAMIAFNNEELMKQVNEILPRYMNAVYTDDDIAQAKEDRARLNAFIKSIDGVRKSVKARYLVPLSEFTEKVNEVISAVEQATGKIGDVITAYDEKCRAEKKAAVTEYFNGVIGDLAPVVPYEKIEDARWYNATAKLKAVYTAIDDKIKKIHEDLGVIEQLGAENAEGLKLYYFRTLNLSAALQENERIKQEKAAIEQMRRQKEEQAQSAAITAEEEQEQAQVQEETGMPKAPPMYVLQFEVKATAAQLQALKACLVENGIKYTAIKKGKEE